MNTITITIGDEVYTSWPKLAIESPLNIYGQLQCSHLDSLLHESFPAYIEWRERIPPEIRFAIVRMPEARVELLLLAQAWPERFLDIYRRAPAWLLVAANYWMFQCPRRLTRPSDEERENFYHWFYLAPKRNAFARLGFESNQKVRLLGKLGRGCCLLDSAYTLRRIFLDVCSTKLLTHLERLNRSVLRLALHPFAAKDFQLLRLASEKPFDRDESFEGLFHQIEDWLARVGRDGDWPYRGCIRSWTTLRRIRTRLQRECGSVDPFETFHPDAEFRESPLNAEDAKKWFDLEVTALNTSGLLAEESRLMSNCSTTYTPVVSTMEELFLYRIVAPFRATLLVQRIGGEWTVSQLYGPANSEVEEAEHKLVKRWLEWENGKRSS